MARVPQDTGDERLIPRGARSLDGLRAARRGDRAGSRQLGLVPDFVPPRGDCGAAAALERVRRADAAVRRLGRAQRGARREAGLSRWYDRAANGALQAQAERAGVAASPSRRPPTRRALRRDRAADRGQPRRAATARRERRLLRLRHHAGLRLLEGRAAAPSYPAPDAGAAARTAAAAGDRRRSTLTPGLLRAGHPARRLPARARPRRPRRGARASPSEIDRAFAERARARGGRPATGLLRGVRAARRASRSPRCGRGSSDGGGVLAADAPRLAFEMLELFAARRAAAARRRLPRRAAAAVGAQDDAAQGRARRSAAPGTRTARSWATCAR